MLYLRESGLTYGAIARREGLSRERIRQIVGAARRMEEACLATAGHAISRWVELYTRAIDVSFDG